MKHGPGLCSRLLRLTEPSVHRGLGPQHSPLDSRPGGVGVKGKEGEWPRGPMETRGQNWKTSLSDKSITTLIVRKRASLWVYKISHCFPSLSLGCITSKMGGGEYKLPSPVAL